MCPLPSSGRSMSETNRFTPRATRWFSVLALLLATGCEDPPEPQPHPQPPAPRYQATIYRTEYGVPHIRADNLAGVASGQGYAFAQDQACGLAEAVLRLRGEQARYRGPEFVGIDIAHRVLDPLGRAEQLLPQQPQPVRELLGGFVAGYNHYLARVGPANVPGWCHGAPWVAPITETELMAHHLTLGMLASGLQFLPAIAAAQPPGTTAPSQTPPLESLVMSKGKDFGSNGWALGRERTRSGRGMLVANPHFPWEGELRLWESHLSVPGTLDVYGASLLGVPGILIGFNPNVAWTHTFSSVGQRFTLYLLPLVPGKPTRYYYGDEEREMAAKAITVKVLQPDGSLADVTRTVYSSHYGPILSLQGLEWSTKFAISYRDANRDNGSMVAQYLAMAQADSLQALQQAHATYQSLPWVNTISVDRQGHTWFTDSSRTPNLSAETLTRWQQQVKAGNTPAALVYQSTEAVLLDGSEPSNEWVVEAGAGQPGVIPFERAPQLSRDDFVFNSNDSHWLTNPAAPLEGFSPLQGPERTAQTMRTRMNATLLTEVREGGASGADGKFTQPELKEAILGNRSFTAELLREELVARCQAHPSATVEGQAVDLTHACATLAGWEGRFDTGSTGAVLWREFLGTFSFSQSLGAGELFATPFDPAHPLTTPTGLRPAPATGEDPLLTRLGRAVRVLEQAKLALDVPLGQVQNAPRGGKRIPLHGGRELEGTANVVGRNGSMQSLEPRAPQGTVLNRSTNLTTQGYVISTGTSFLMALEYTEDGVRAEGMLTYGESADAQSPHYSDQAELFSAKQWRPMRTDWQDIIDHAGSSVETISLP
ncbi:acylase [Cystobacter ferrugineus]|uniref:Acylase n=2 Tax=Cystobacter ferrugineus TaxID=83449 RepID=A0A1L9B0X4_9BACT|nr:acylase [Cystobacter ferrugineus]